ncbi:MAG: stage 0 sporulation family protein [Clostridiales bacterium]|nr:stage 0 sporulation family protein [Clostridiales bacterium]
MVEIIGVRFKDVGKIYYFSPKDEKLPVGSVVIVETARGVESGTVVLPNRMIDESEVHPPLKEIIRVATKEDKEKIKLNRIKEKEILKVFAEKIEKHKLDMKPIGIDCTFDGNKIMFYFTSENRVDFRELVKDLAAIYRTRIELRQIGVRDEAKLLGGLGVCGRPFCCKTFLGEFQPVSIKMAKEQSLSLNPVKISGTCGRLMCCLKYEQDCYEELLAITPKQGAYVQTKEGKGTVEEVNLLTGNLKVKLDNNLDGSSISVHRDNVKIIKDARIKLNADEIMALKSLEDN